jgi:ComF family protein
MKKKSSVDEIKQRFDNDVERFLNMEKGSIFKKMKKGVHAFEQFLYPPKCLKCRTYMDNGIPGSRALESCFCDLCLSTGFNLITRPYCIKCGIQLPGDAQIENHVCQSCLKIPLTLEKIRAVSEYSGIIKEAVPLFKYQSKLSLAKVLESLLFQTFLDHFEKMPVDLIMPIPLHWTKLMQRGFNQAYLLVRSFKQLYHEHFGITPGWDVDIHAMTRKKKTDSQTGFDVDQRKTNLKNAFSIADPEKIKGQCILLVDDVLTTGATCNEAAALLLESGAERVYALVLARA